MSKLHQDHLVVRCELFIDDIDKFVPIFVAFPPEKENLFII